MGEFISVTVMLIIAASALAYLLSRDVIITAGASILAFVIPRVYIDFKETSAMTSQEIRQKMLEGELPVAIGETDSGVRVDVMMLEEWQVRAVARKLRKVLSSAQS